MSRFENSEFLINDDDIIGEGSYAKIFDSLNNENEAFVTKVFTISKIHPEPSTLINMGEVDIFFNLDSVFLNKGLNFYPTNKEIYPSDTTEGEDNIKVINKEEPLKEKIEPGVTKTFFAIDIKKADGSITEKSHKSYENFIQLSLLRKYKIIKHLFFHYFLGLKCLHDNNYFHLDITNNNLMYSFINGQLIGQLIDYGSAIKAEKNLNKEFVSIKTIHKRFNIFYTPYENMINYCEPESISENTIEFNYNNKSDIWALAVCFLAALKGKNLGLEANIRAEVLSWENNKKFNDFLHKTLKGKIPLEDPFSPEKNKNNSEKNNTNQESPRREKNIKEKNDSIESPRREKNAPVESPRREKNAPVESPRREKNAPVDNISQESSRKNNSSQESPRKNNISQESPRKNTSSQESSRKDSISQESPRKDSISQESSKKDSVSQESPRKEKNTRSENPSSSETSVDKYEKVNTVEETDRYENGNKKHKKIIEQSSENSNIEYINLIDLLNNILNIDNNKRFDVNQVINHKYFSDIRPFIFGKDNIENIIVCKARKLNIKKILKPLVKSKFSALNVNIKHKYNGIKKVCEICQKFFGNKNLIILFKSIDLYIRIILNVDQDLISDDEYYETEEKNNKKRSKSTTEQPFHKEILQWKTNEWKNVKSTKDIIGSLAYISVFITFRLFHTLYEIPKVFLEKTKMEFWGYEFFALNSVDLFSHRDFIYEKLSYKEELLNVFKKLNIPYKSRLSNLLKDKDMYLQTFIDYLTFDDFKSVMLDKNNNSERSEKICSITEFFEEL